MLYENQSLMIADICWYCIKSVRCRASNSYRLNGNRALAETSIISDVIIKTLINSIWVNSDWIDKKIKYLSVNDTVYNVSIMLDIGDPRRYRNNTGKNKIFQMVFLPIKHTVGDFCRYGEQAIIWYTHAKTVKGIEERPVSCTSVYFQGYINR